MTDGLIKRDWIERAELTSAYHKEKLRSNINHKVSDTAEQLKRSKGRISEDLMIVEWLKTHRKQIEKFKTMIDALNYIREKKKELRLL